MELNFKIKKADSNFEIRNTNLQSFKKKGFPNKKNEEWKFTDLEKIISDNFKELNNRSFKTNKPKKINLGFDHNSIVVVNGKLSSFDFKFEKFYQNNFVPVKELDLNYHLNFSENNNSNSMQNLNTALYESGFSLNIEEGYKFKKPIVFFNYFTGDFKNKIINNSEIIKMSKDSQATVIEYLVDATKGKYFKNTFKCFDIQDNASLNYYFINRKNSANFFYDYSKIKLLTNSSFKKYIFSSGLKFYKSDNNIILAGKKSNSEIYSGLFLDKNNHHEIKTLIQHLQPDCQSHQSIKNVLTSGSKGVFQGKIYVDKIAQKTNAYQLSKGLLLDEKAEFSTKPELEIYADDVKCSHGSTSGNIDTNALFYLKARGIKEKEAIKMIVKGFLESILKNVENIDVKSLVESHFINNLNYEN